MPILLAFDLAVLLVMAAISAVVIVVALAIGLVTHPLRTLAVVFGKLAALVGGLALILALLIWFASDHSHRDFIPGFYGSIGVIVLCVAARLFTDWFLARPTRAERREAEERQRELDEQRILEKQRLMHPRQHMDTSGGDLYVPVSRETAEAWARMQQPEVIDTTVSDDR